jgi:hypothetical protein
VHRPVTANLRKINVQFTKDKLYDHGDTVSYLTEGKEGIVTLHSSDLFVMDPVWNPVKFRGTRSIGGIEYAQLVAKGRFNPIMWSNHPIDYLRPLTQETPRPFNARDFENPVPASMYFDARRDDCWGIQTHCQTITDDTYHPHLSFNFEVAAKIFSQTTYAMGTDDALDIWTCKLPTVIDPPVALRPIRSRRGAEEKTDKVQLGKVSATPTSTKTVTDSNNQRRSTHPQRWMAEPEIQRDFQPSQARPGTFITAPGPTSTVRSNDKDLGATDIEISGER